MLLEERSTSKNGPKFDGFRQVVVPLPILLLPIIGAELISPTVALNDKQVDKQNVSQLTGSTENGRREIDHKADTQETEGDPIHIEEEAKYHHTSHFELKPQGTTA